MTQTQNGIHFASRTSRHVLIFGYDTLAVPGTILLYMRYGAVYAFNYFLGHLMVQKFCTEVLFSGFFQQFGWIVALQRERMQTGLRR